MKLIIIIAGLGGLLYGVDFGVIAAAEPYLMALGIYSGTRVSLVVGAVMLGGLISSLTAGVLCDWLGRKKMIVAASAMFLLAIPVVCLALDSFPILFAGRILQGMSAGYMAVVMPMYLTACSSSSSASASWSPPAQDASWRRTTARRTLPARTRSPRPPLGAPTSGGRWRPSPSSSSAASVFPRARCGRRGKLGG